MMLTDPIRAEHAELRPHIEQLRDLADAVDELPLAKLRDGVAQAHAFLGGQLIPHAHAEDKALYPAVAHLMGAVEATRTMSRDHVEVGRLTDQLAALHAVLEKGAPDGSQIKSLRRVLYGLYAVVVLHFAKEEEIYLPLLERGLSESEARDMFQAMHDAAAKGRREPAHGAHHP
jgi:iron-sulfur cluster repair protein YtfE (RIC family)